MFDWDRDTRPVLQAENSECGLACLVMVARHHGRREGLSELRRRFQISATGINLKGLMAIADVLGLAPRAVRCELDELTRLDLPCILHWDMDHYVVLSKVRGKNLEILDPAKGRRILTTAEVSHHFTGVALELTPTRDFEKKKVIEKVALSDLWSRLIGFYPIFIQLFCLTLVLQFFGLIMPIANQIIIDDVIGQADKSLLVSIIAGFAIVAFVQTAVELLRTYIQLYAAQRITIQLNGNVLRHLLRLPTDFFERRHVGDILARFGSLAPVQNFLTAGVIGGVLDAIMVIPTGIVMFIYSPILSALVVADVVLVFVVQAATFGRNKRYLDENIAMGAKAQSIFLETLRAATAIKLAGKEADRLAIWQNAVTEQQNMSFRQSVFAMWGGAGFGLVMTLQGLLMLYFGATLIMSGHLSLGMLIAFQSYAMQFSGRAKSLVGQFFGFRMLDLHLERLGDIVQADIEPGLEGHSVIQKPLRGEIEMRGVGFRYGTHGPWVLRDANIVVQAGERMVLTGPSGGGKSTLMKLMCGLYEPTEGEVLIDGLSLHSYGLKPFREQIGVVMQDDQLLSGTIGDNVAFGDPEVTAMQIEDACRLSYVHEDIMRLPMGYHTLVGDMGSVLSGGQRQRVLLARALCRRPRILFMDEGTANLDSILEEGILENLRRLNITQIMVAHRQAAIDHAERMYHVSQDTCVKLVPRSVHEIVT